VSPTRHTVTTSSYYVGLTGKQVEIDHLKTTLVALEQKVQVTEDIQNELDDKHRNLMNSEHARDELHVRHIELTEW
jgi:hypothetical protein